MNFPLLLIAISAGSIAQTVDKLNFNTNKVSSRLIMLLTFFAMMAMLVLFTYLIKPPFPVLSLTPIALLVSIGLISFAGNVFDYFSLKVDDLSLREPLSDFEPMLAGLFGYLLFPGERKLSFLIAFVLGSFIVYWGTHRIKLRALQKKGMFQLLLAILFYALLPSIYKLTLEFVRPEYIALFRVSTIFLLLAAFLPAKNVIKGATLPTIVYSFSAGILYVCAAITNLYAIDIFGVTLTMLLLLLGPFLRYLLASFILKEHVKKTEVVTSLLLVVLVLVTLLV